MKKYKNGTKLFKISLFLLGIGIIFSLGINTTTAANPSNIYVNGSSGNDNWNGLNSTYISGINGPKATITNATGTVKSDGTIYIASGTYNESNIQINTNMNIIGENQKNTIINGQQSGNSIFTIANGVNFTIINLTLTNNTAYDGGAIYNGGTLTIENSTFTNNTATDNGKGGGVIYNGGITLTIENSTFTNNNAEYGGVIDNGGSLTVDNSTFTNNTAVAAGAIFNFGDAITVDNSTFINNTANYGGAIDNAYYSTLSVDNSTFTGNNATENGDGGAIYNNAGTLNIENSTFTNNTASDYTYGGGAIYNTAGTLTVENSTFTSNNGGGSGGAIYNSGTLTIENSTFTNNTAVAAGAIFNFGSTFTVGNSTFTNNTANSGGAIDNQNSGTLTVDNSTFTNNTASNNGSGGGAIYNAYGTTLTVDNSTFTNNTTNLTGGVNGGGAIFNSGTLSVDNSTFTNNTTNGSGGAILNVGILTVDNSTFTNNNGGAISDYGTLTVENSTFTNNFDGSIDESGSATVESSTFINNTAPYDNAIYNTGTMTITYNRFVGNSATDINGGKGSTNAEDNWWGTNLVGTTPQDAGRVDFTVSKWIVLTVKANPVTINNGAKSTVTADLLHDNLGNYLNPVNGHVPDGITVNFNSDGLGTVNPETNNTTNGSTNTTFIGHSIGVSEVSATIDQQTATTNITIKKILSAYLYLQITSSNKNPRIGESFTLTYKLGNKGPDNATNVTINIPLPSGFKVSNITGDGNWTYNLANNTLTWTLANVKIGDPYLYITGKTSTSGVYVFSSKITSETFNINTKGVTPIVITITNPTNPITPINPVNPTNPTTTTNASTILNAATTTIPMQHTGLPIAGLILAILSVFGGSIMSRKK